MLTGFIPRLALASLLLMPFASPGTAVAQGPDSASAQNAPCPPNAALAYWRAWNGRYPQLFDNRYLETEFRGIKPDWLPPPEVAALLEAAQSDIKAICKATWMDNCDWGVPLREEGFETPLPHLPKFRTTSRVLMADARRLLAKNDPVAAAERLAALMLMGRQLRSDKTVYSVRTGQSTSADLGMYETRRLAEAGKFNTEASRKILLDALAKLDVPDPCGMREALAEQPQVLRLSVRRLCTGPDAAKTYIQKYTPKATPEARAQSGLEQLDEAGLYSAVDRMVVLYQDVLANWDLPEPTRQIRAIDEQRKAGDFGAAAVLQEDDLPHLRNIVANFERLTKETIRAVKGEAAPAGAPTPPSPAPQPAPDRK